jgi:hypothetical protein
VHEVCVWREEAAEDKFEVSRIDKQFDDLVDILCVLSLKLVSEHVLKARNSTRMLGRIEVRELC